MNSPRKASLLSESAVQDETRRAFNPRAATRKSRRPRPSQGPMPDTPAWLRKIKYYRDRTGQLVRRPVSLTGNLMSAPEQWFSDPEEEADHQRTDLWRLGISDEGAIFRGKLLAKLIGVTMHTYKDTKGHVYNSMRPCAEGHTHIDTTIADR